MRRIFLLALPLASLLMCVGCDESQYGYGQPSYSSPSSSQTTAARSAQAQTTTSTTTAPAATTSYSSSRNSTTQPLPSGWGYIHEGELTGGRLPANASSTTQTTVARTTNGI